MFILHQQFVVLTLILMLNKLFMYLQTKRMLKCVVAAWASSRGRKKQGGNAGAGQAADDVQVKHHCNITSVLAYRC